MDWITISRGQRVAAAAVCRITVLLSPSNTNIVLHHWKAVTIDELAYASCLRRRHLQTVVPSTPSLYYIFSCASEQHLDKKFSGFILGN